MDDLSTILLHINDKLETESELREVRHHPDRDLTAATTQQGFNVLCRF